MVQMLACGTLLFLQLAFVAECISSAEPCWAQKPCLFEHTLKLKA